jgi:hypothetical protein
MTKLCSTKRAAGSVFCADSSGGLAIGVIHRTPLQSTRKQKLMQKHSQKMGRGRVFWSARFVGREPSIRRTARLQRRRVLYPLKDRDFGGRAHRTRA